MQRWIQHPRSRIVLAVILTIGGIVPFVPAVASASTFQQSYIRLDRMKAPVATGATVCAQPATVATEGKVVVTFPTTYTLNTTAANWTVSTGTIPAGSTAWPSIATATAVDNTAKTATFPSGDLTVGTLYCFAFSDVNTLTTAASPATNQQARLETQTSGASTIDTSRIALANIADDQIVVTAVVPPSFSFVLSGNTDAFAADLDITGVVSTGGRTVTVTTNSKGGWIAWVKDSQQGLYSPTTAHKINTSGSLDGSPTTLSNGIEGYVLDADLTTDAAAGCTLAVDGEYNGTGTTQGGTLGANYYPVASCTGVPPATANGDVITLVERATIGAVTPAGSDYSDIITVVGAGNF